MAGERFEVRKSGPGYEWLPAWCVVDTEEQVRAAAYNDEASAREHCAELNLKHSGLMEVEDA